MKYSEGFRGAHPFEEVLPMVYKTLVPAKCIWCLELCLFCTYQFNQLPIPVCGQECRKEIEEFAVATASVPSRPEYTAGR